MAMQTVYAFCFPLTTNYRDFLSYFYLLGCDISIKQIGLSWKYYYFFDAFLMNSLLFQWVDAVLRVIGKPWTVPWTAETIRQVRLSL